MNTCRVVKEKLKHIMSFGKMPIANNFLSRTENFSKEEFFDLDISFSEKVSLLQLTKNPSINKMFHCLYRHTIVT